mmetsp:Transcript_22436/g.42044  ORF Transcript_22436/g.42044 Transcript_22436/m.42044 type:complete len:104 (+) Transcript_22436:206-517(+)
MHTYFYFESDFVYTMLGCTIDRSSSCLSAVTEFEHYRTFLFKKNLQSASFISYHVVQIFAKKAQAIVSHLGSHILGACSFTFTQAGHHHTHEKFRSVVKNNSS